MNKTDLIEHIAHNADISKAAAARTLDATIAAVKSTLKKGGTISLVGFGTFSVNKRAARTGRNLALAKQSKSRPPRCPSSPQAKHSRMR